MRRYELFLVLSLVIPSPGMSALADPYLSQGRKADPTAKTLSEIRASERRRIPVEVLLKASPRYELGAPVRVTIIVTNLFDPPLLMNSRMLVNHPLLQGELFFHIVGPNGKTTEFRRLITPLSLRDADFVPLTRGQSIQRGVDLADLHVMTRRGVYKVEVSYHNEIDYRLGSMQAWKGIISSEPVEIQIQ